MQLLHSGDENSPFQGFMTTFVKEQTCPLHDITLQLPLPPTKHYHSTLLTSQ